MSLLSVVALLSGCTPQDADVQAKYAIYLAAASSDNLTRLERTGTDVEGHPGALGLTPIDCRDLSGLETADEIAASRLSGVDFAAECCGSGATEGDETCGSQPEYFDWINQYAYYLAEGDVDPWRTEAVITTEGDFQLTVHMDFPKIGDFRFGWVINPTFQPQVCADTPDGSQLTDVDGDWLGGWSAGESGTLWQLNAGSYQINPSDNAVAWYFDQPWEAGSSFARFGDEEFYGHATDYADPLYRPYYQNTYLGDCSDGGDNDGDGDKDSADKECRQGKAFEGPQIPAASADYEQWVTDTRTYFNGNGEDQAGIDDLSTLGKSSFPLEMKIEDNSWRASDGVASGLDGWLGVSPSWVLIDNPQDIGVHPDKPITGKFQVYLEGVAAASKVFVNGSFSINNVRSDVWGYQYGTLDEVKREENNTPTCGEDRLTTAD